MDDQMSSGETSVSLTQNLYIALKNWSRELAYALINSISRLCVYVKRVAELYKYFPYLPLDYCIFTISDLPYEHERSNMVLSVVI